MTDSYNPRARVPARQAQMPPAPPYDSAGRQVLVEPPTPSQMMRPIPRGTPKLTEAIAAIQREIGIINKGGENKFHNYKYARIEDVLEVLTPLLGQHGLAIFQNELDIQQIESRVAVKYEFTVTHTSGEVQGPFLKYGMSNARDSKGNWDDKCINKCHTQARRYFLVGLFNIPTAELDDGERQSAHHAPDQTRARATPVPARDTTPREETNIKPQKIGLGAGVGAEKWAERFVQMVGQATSRQEVMAWDKLNNDALTSLADGFAEVYERVCAAIEMRIKVLAANNPSAAIASAENVASFMPDPRKDATTACNWVAQQLAEMKTAAALDAFWDQVVAPAEDKFLPPDFAVLLIELRRAQARLGVVHSEGVADDESGEQNSQEDQGEVRDPAR